MAMSSDSEFWRGSFLVKICFLSFLCCTTKCTACTIKIIPAATKTDNRELPRAPHLQCGCRVAQHLAYRPAWYAQMTGYQSKANCWLRGYVNMQSWKCCRLQQIKSQYSSPCAITPLSNVGTPYISSVAKRQRL